MEACSIVFERFIDLNFVSKRLSRGTLVDSARVFVVWPSRCMSETGLIVAL